MSYRNCQTAIQVAIASMERLRNAGTHAGTKTMPPSSAPPAFRKSFMRATLWASRLASAAHQAIHRPERWIAPVKADIGPIKIKIVQNNKLIA